MEKNQIILADIGGTHARFARWEDGILRDPQKRRAADYPSFLACAADYAGPRSGTIHIAAAGNRLRWPNQYNHWIVDQAALAEAGWQVAAVVNDFMASAHGIDMLDPADLTTLRAGRALAGTPRALLGPGTGLGLAYLLPQGDSWRVQETYGGHMLAAPGSDEHHEILRIIGTLKEGDKAVVFENVASGSGLVYLYKAACHMHGLTPSCLTAEDILVSRDKAAKEAIRYFHEFLGLFAHHALITGHAFGGLYLDGGMLHRLQEAGLWDARIFLGALDRPLLPVVGESVAQTPLYIVTDPFIALKGLAEMAAHGR